MVMLRSEMWISWRIGASSGTREKSSPVAFMLVPRCLSMEAIGKPPPDDGPFYDIS
jgi:hypothetical protein